MRQLTLQQGRPLYRSGEREDVPPISLARLPDWSEELAAGAVAGPAGPAATGRRGGGREVGVHLQRTRVMRCCLGYAR